MSLWNINTPPELYPNAVATPAGWADPITGELYVAVGGLSTYKGGAAELTQVRLLTDDPDVFNTGASLKPKVYPAGEYLVFEALFNEPVTWTGDAPKLTVTIDGNARTASYFVDATDVLAHTADKVMSVTIGSGGTNYQVGDKITFTVNTGAGHTGSSAEAVVSSVGGSNAISGITMVHNGASYDIAPTPVVHTGYVKSITVGGSGTAYVNGDALTFTTAGSTTSATGYIVTNSAGNVTRAVVTSGGVGYTSAPTVGKTSLYGSGNTFTAVTSYGSGASLTAVLGTPANGKGTNRILFRYQIQANETAAPEEIVLASPVESVGTTNWGDSDSGGGASAAATATISGGVTSFSGITAGSGYTAAPRVTINSATGTGATAHAVLDKGINTVTPTIAGTGYRSAPLVTLTGDTGNEDGSVTAVLATSGIACDVTIGGSATTGIANDTPLIVDNTGHGGTGFAGTLQTDGNDITGVTITNAGSGYTSAPELTVGDPGLGTRTLTAVIGKAIASFTVAAAGTGFVSAPGISIAAPTATAGTTTAGAGVTLRTQATASSTLKNLDTVKSLVVDNPGYGYVAATAVFTNASGDVTGQDAAATPVISNVVKSVTVTNGGSGFGVAPTVVFTGGTSGTPATATSTIDGGRITAVTMTNHGDSYTVAPAVSFTPVAEVPTLTFDVSQYVAGVTVASGGTGYSTGTALVFDSGDAAGTIIANSSGVITGAVLTDGGSYVSAPTITVTAPPTWSGAVTYSLGDVVVRSGTRYKSKANGNLNQQPPNGTWWTVLNDATLTAVMRSPIIGESSVDGVAPTIDSSDITHDRFGDTTAQVAFVTGDWFTVTINTTKPVFVVNGSGATIALDIDGDSQELTYFSGSGTTELHFAYQVTDADSATATNVTIADPIVLAVGTTIKDAAGNDLVLTFTEADTSGVSFN